MNVDEESVQRVLDTAVRDQRVRDVVTANVLDAWRSYTLRYKVREVAPELGITLDALDRAFKTGYPS